MVSPFYEIGTALWPDLTVDGGRKPASRCPRGLWTTARQHGLRTRDGCDQRYAARSA